MRSVWIALLGALTLVSNGQLASAQMRGAADASTLKLYVLDGGVLASELGRYGLEADDVEEVSLSIASFLIVHPRGVLLWDAGAVSDAERIPAGAGAVQRVVRADGDERFVTLGAPLLAQIAVSGYTPEEISHLALSHYHWDHTAGAAEFPDAEWLVTRREWEVMFAAEPPGGARPQTFATLKGNRTTLIDTDEFDVFGDGRVVIKQAPGHTEGHLVLYVDLEHTGPVLLSGDLYHYPAERTLERLPDFEYSQEETTRSREQVEAFLERTGAQLWIQHDLVHHRSLRLAPEYYD
jgi:glyoxylase-like metal-dependent hydrolase (beta-lactamase superfamily II)